MVQLPQKMANILQRASLWNAGGEWPQMLPGDLIVLASKAHYPYINICAASQQQSAVFSREYFKSELLECQIGSVWLHFNYSILWLMLGGEGRCATSVGKGRYVCKITAYKTLLCLSASPQEWGWRSAMSLSTCSSGVLLWASARVTFLRECCLSLMETMESESWTSGLLPCSTCSPLYQSRHVENTARSDQ